MNHKKMRASQSGFVLVFTLGFLAVLTIAVTYFSERVAKGVEGAVQSQRQVSALVEMASTRAEFLYYFATGGFSPLGLGVAPETVISLDNRPYRGVGTDLIRLQDNRGLLNLNFPDLLLLQRLLLSRGVPAEKHPALFDALKDYSDIDDFRRLNGAEKEEYRAANLPPPPNEWLTTPLQLQSVYGWSELAELWRTGNFMSLFSVARQSGFNPATAPRELLVALSGIENKALIDEIISLRYTNPVLANAKAFALLAIQQADNDNLVTFPGNSIRITQSSPDIPWAIQTNITLTTFQDVAPWHIDYYAKVPSESKSSDENTIPRLPRPPSGVVARANSD